MNNQKKKYFGSIILLLLIGLLYFVQSNLIEHSSDQIKEKIISQNQGPDSNEDNHDVIVEKENRKRSPEEQYHAFIATKPLYLQNTEIPARFAIDEQGNLVINSDIRDIFDYFLLMKGDLPDDDIQSIIAGFIATQLQEPARTQATTLLSHYHEYLQRYAQWRQESGTEAVGESDSFTLRETLQQMHSLRLETLGEAVESSFFAEEEKTNNAYLDAKIALSQVEGDTQARTQIIENLKASLPEDVRQAQEAAMVQVTLSEKMAAMKAAGASVEQINKERTALVGAEANQRLAVLDDERKNWQQKREAYKAFRKQHPEVDDMTQEVMAATPSLSNMSLNAQELMRMKALDRIEASVQPVSSD